MIDLGRSLPAVRCEEPPPPLPPPPTLLHPTPRVALNGLIAEGGSWPAVVKPWGNGVCFIVSVRVTLFTARI